MLKVIQKFSSETSLHGFIYICQPTRHKIEQIFWTLAIFTSFTVTGVLIYKFIVESQVNPIVIYTDQNAISPQDIYFPSLSFCPGIIFESMTKPFKYRSIKEKLDNGTMTSCNLTLNELKMMQIVSLVANDRFMSERFPNMSIPTDNFMDVLSTFGSFVGDPAPRYFYPYIHFKGNWSNKYPMNLTRTLWRTGFCHTFNFPNSSQMFHMASISQDYNYTSISMHGTEFHDKPQYKLKLNYPVKPENPTKSLYIGYNEATYTLRNHSRPKMNGVILLDAIPERKYHGLFLWFHDAFEMLYDNAIKLHARKRCYLKILITPKVSKIDTSIIDFDLEQRLCYLKNERELKFFKVYNKVNCEHECLANLTLQTCGCVQFFMVRNQTTRICGTIDEVCFRNVEDEFINVKSTCLCYEPCETVKYEVKPIFDFRKKDWTSSSRPGNSDIEIEIQFGMKEIFAVKKRKTMTVVDIFSLIGGFLGLFAGFSFLSAIEIILHFLVYPLCIVASRRSTKVHATKSKDERKRENHVSGNFLGIITNFFKSSSIHSFNHIANSKKKFLERWIWSLLFIISMLLSLFMVQEAFNKLITNRIYMSLEGQSTNVEDLKFPAFTLIADVNDGNLKTNYKEMKENTNEAGKHFRWKRSTDDYKTLLKNQVYYMLCRKIAAGAIGTRISVNFTSTSDFVNTLQTETDLYRPWFIHKTAKWNKVVDPPFAEILTQNGFGYTFNLMNNTELLYAKRLSKDFYYTFETNDTISYPWSTKAGVDFGLEINFKMNKLYEGCYDYDSFIIHPPNELPIYSDLVRFEDLVTSDVVITPEIIKTDDDLKRLDVNVRKCYFEDERKLKYFKAYTQRNCEQECLTEIIYADCGCVPFYSIRNSSIEICDFKTFVECAIKYEAYSNFKKYDHLYESKDVCSCLPQCNSVTYSYDVFTRDFNIVQNTTISVMWKDAEYYALIRYQQFTVVDFLAYVGGILGLFAGISALSIIEFLYFFTLRLATDLFRIFWSSSIFASLSITGVLIYKFIVESQVNPIVIYTDQNAINAQDIYFPSVSFCPGIITRTMLQPFKYQVMKEMLENQTLELSNFTLKELKMMQIGSLVANDRFMSAKYPNLSVTTEDFLDVLDYFGFFLSPTIATFKTAPYDNIFGNWSNMYPMNLTRILSPTGYCYTFNFPNSSQMFHMESISQDFNYTKVYMIGTESPHNSQYKLQLDYPAKPENPTKCLYIGFQDSAFIPITNKTHEFIHLILNDVIPERNHTGLMFLFHDAFEILHNDAIRFNARHKCYKKILVTPKLSRIDESIMDFNLDQRQCYLENERELKFFKVYNKINCEHECLANLTLKTCSCAQFFMVRNQTTRICGIIDENCFRNVEDEFINVKSACLCYEPCDTVKYEVKPIYDFRKKSWVPLNVPKYSDMEVNVQFSMKEIFAVTKRKTMTTVDIFSLIGGFLGLFAGFSFLSAGEIIFHFVINPLVKIASRRSRKIQTIQNKIQLKIKNQTRNFLAKTVRNFLENSSIHSLNHIGNNNNKFMKRLIWLFLFITSMILSYFMIHEAFNKLQIYKIYMSLEGQETNIEDIPFPAFTLVADVNDKDFLNYFEMKENGIKDKYFRTKRNSNPDYLSLVSAQVYYILCKKLNAYAYGQRKNVEYLSTSDFVDSLRLDTYEETPWFIYKRTYWNKVIVELAFAEILTQNGFGYTFNLMDQSKLLYENWISKDFHYKYETNNTVTYPWSTKAGIDFGFEINFKMNKLKEGCYDYDSFIVHPPNELPIYSDLVRFEDLVTSDVVVTPEIIKTDNDLKRLDLSTRKCYFDDERKLKYFKVYTQKNCEQECLTEIIYADCGCVPFFSIRNSSTKMCDYKNYVECAGKYDAFSSFMKYEHLYESQSACKCLPQCNYVSYSYEVLTRDFETIQNTTISVMWKDAEYYALIRYQQFTVVDFLAYVGGILGLFAGISALSVIEFLYFFTLRLAIDLIRYYNK